MQNLPAKQNISSLDSLCVQIAYSGIDGHAYCTEVNYFYHQLNNLNINLKIN